ncbi:hypothetical protein L7F22_025110 [Adiantum nelumboides]|nr:hypothetical protein [Adiantum nelumboides]
MDPEKLKVIEEWPQPKNLHELRSFIGMCAYYRRFIEKFSVIAGPLHDLTKKKVKFQWTDKEEKAFKTLKSKLVSESLLKLPDLSKPFEVHCDACGDSLGAVLLQNGHPIAYESRRFNDQERVLGIYEKELLAAIHALESWKHYLLGTPFVLQTDHQSLRYFMTQTKLGEKQMRWANFLSQFHFHIAHVAGKQNPVADALSRRPRVNAVSIAYHQDLTTMIDDYKSDTDFAQIYEQVKEALQRAQVKQKEAADKHRRHLDLKEDDWMLLKFPKARLQHTTGKDRQGTPNGHQKFYAKLAKKFYGPFQILQKINPTAFRLKLPDHWHIHNAFHASLLKPYKGTPPAAPIEEDPPEFDEMEEILRPKKILKHEDKVLRTGKILRRYLVKFANYPDEDARWMQEPQLKESLALLQEYKAMYNLQDTQ